MGLRHEERGREQADPQRWGAKERTWAALEGGVEVQGIGEERLFNMGNLIHLKQFGHYPLGCYLPKYYLPGIIITLGIIGM